MFQTVSDVTCFSCRESGQVFTFMLNQQLNVHVGLANVGTVTANNNSTVPLPLNVKGITSQSEVLH